MSQATLYEAGLAPAAVVYVGCSGGGSPALRPDVAALQVLCKCTAVTVARFSIYPFHILHIPWIQSGGCAGACMQL